MNQFTAEEYTYHIIDSEGSLGVCRQLLDNAQENYGLTDNDALNENIYIEIRERINLIIDTLGYIDDTKIEENLIESIGIKIDTVAYFISMSKQKYGEYLV